MERQAFGFRYNAEPPDSPTVEPPFGSLDPGYRTKEGASTDSDSELPVPYRTLNPYQYRYPRV